MKKTREINPWHLAGHFGLLWIYEQKRQHPESADGPSTLWERAYERQLDAYYAFMRGEKP